MRTKKPPRRKVVAHRRVLGPTNMLVLELECGHEELGYPRKGAAPTTAGCRKCAQQKEPS